MKADTFKFISISTAVAFVTKEDQIEIYRGEIIVDTDTLLFFDKNPSALPLYEVLETKIYALFPAAKKRVQKTQISFSNRHIFACVSFARV